MDIEQLKLVLETVKSTTGDAKLVGIVYIACSTLSYIAAPIAALMIIPLLVRGACKIIPLFGADKGDDAFVRQARREILPDRAYGEVTPAERADMLRKIREWSAGK